MIRREHPDDRLAAEIEEHLALLAADYERQGMSAVDAALAARKAFGAVQQVQEAHRDGRGSRWWSDVRADVRYGARGLVKAPVFAGVAILTLALGIGANTAIFSIINGLFLRQLPLPSPEQLIELRGVPPDLRALDVVRAQRDLFQGAGSHEMTQFNLGTGADAEWVDGLWASARFIDTIGAGLALGRSFGPDDDRAAVSADVPGIISYRLWQRRFGGSREAIGQRLTVNRVPVRIVGVTERGFFGVVPGRSFDVMLPMALRASMYTTALFGNDVGRVVARLRPGVGADEAATRLRQRHVELRAEMARQGIVTDGDQMQYAITVGAVSGRDLPGRQSQYERPLTILMGLVGFVLLIACANLANLLMARATSRRQELSIRRALGATRLRLIRQLVVESGVIAAAGAVVGVLFAIWASEFLVGLLAGEAAFSGGRMMYGAATLRVDLSLDWRVLGFTAAAAVTTVLLFGAAPAIIGSRVRPMDALKEHGQNTPDRRPATLAGVVIAAQVAISLLLLVGALLLGRTFAMVTDVDFGFEPERVLTVDADPPRGLDARSALDAYRRALVALRTLPVVAGAGLSNGALSGGFHLPVTTESIRDVIGVQPVSDGWFDALGGTLRAGRDFTEADRLGAPPVAIVNEAFARRFFQGANPIGRPVEIPGDGELLPPARLTVVGLVANITVSARQEAAPQLYLSLHQIPPQQDVIAIALEEGGLSFSVRSAGPPPLALRAPVADAMARVQPDFGLTFRAMSDELAGLLTQERVLALLSGFFGALGLLLAAVGLYGVTSYAVGRRRKEIGIRLVLGAQRGTVVGMVLSRAALLLAVGVATGAVGSLWLSQFLVALLFGVEPQDPATLVAAAAVLVAVGAAAAALPAYRASRMTTADVLRET